jgi:hypothetical protein
MEAQEHRGRAPLAVSHRGAGLSVAHMAGGPVQWDIPGNGSRRQTVDAPGLTTSPGRALAPGTQHLCRHRGQRLRVLPAPAARGRPLGLRLWRAELPAPRAGLRHVYHGVSNPDRVGD